MLSFTDSFHRRHHRGHGHDHSRGDPRHTFVHDGRQKLAAQVQVTFSNNSVTAWHSVTGLGYF